METLAVALIIVSRRKKPFQNGVSRTFSTALSLFVGR